MFELMKDPRLEPLDVTCQKYGKLTYSAFDGYVDYEGEFLRTSRVAEFVFRAPGGSVVTLGGIDGTALRELVDQAEHIPDDRRALFVRLRPAGSVEAYVEQVIAVLAETAMRLWPVWFTDVSFAMCCDDALDPREVVADAHAPYFGLELGDRSLVPSDNPRVGATRFDDWLGQSTRQK
jgi:hypothetical protein